jgi:hypothetical protein
VLAFAALANHQNFACKALTLFFEAADKLSEADSSLLIALLYKSR